jgi:hypothetical protein
MCLQYRKQSLRLSSNFESSIGAGIPKRWRMEIRFLAGISLLSSLILGVLIFLSVENDQSMPAFLAEAISKPRFFQVLNGAMVVSRLKDSPATGNRGLASLSFPKERAGESDGPSPARPEQIKKWIDDRLVPESKNALFEQFVLNPEGVREALLDGLRNPESRLQSIEVLGWWVGSSPEPERIRWLNSELLSLDLTDGLQSAIYQEGMETVQGAGG